MEVSPHSAAIDFSHYSEYPDEYAMDAYMDIPSSGYAAAEREDDLDSTERDIQEQLIRGADYDAQLGMSGMNEHGEAIEEDDHCWPSSPQYSGTEYDQFDSYDEDSLDDDVHFKEAGYELGRVVYDDECSSEESDEDEIPRKRARPSADDEEDEDEGEGEGEDVDRKAKPIMVASSAEMLRIRFPFQSLSVRLSDYLAVQEGDLLSDTVIDFYLNHVVEHLLPDEPDRRVTVLPAVFWHNLSLRQKVPTVCVDDDESVEERDQSDAARFGDLLEFVGEHDLIDVDYVVVPVSEWEHWSIIVIVKPFTPSARILCFDSALEVDPNDLSAAAALLAEFFQFVHKEQRGTAEPVTGVGRIIPKRLPQQENSMEGEFNSGVYALEYIRRFLMAPPKKIGREFDFSREYRDFSIEATRSTIQRAFLTFSPNRVAWEKLLSVLKPAN